MILIGFKSNFWELILIGFQIRFKVIVQFTGMGIRYKLSLPTDYNTLNTYLEKVYKGLFAQLHIITGDKSKIKKKLLSHLKKDMGLLREHLLSLSSWNDLFLGTTYIQQVFV